MSEPGYIAWQQARGRLPDLIEEALEIYDEFMKDDAYDAPIDGEPLFNELATQIMKLRALFLNAGFQPPKAIELASHEDGYKLRNMLPRDMVFAHAAEARKENDTDVVFNLMGIEFRYPAHFRRERGKTRIL